ncbi:MAG: CPBP family intramembrane glutamic endopeptidase [Balneolaceae bacterium]
MDNTYFRQSSQLLYSYLMAVPLLLLYEGLLRWSSPDTELAVRVSVDVWFQTLIHWTGLDALSVTLFLVAAAGLVILWRDRSRIRSIKGRYLLWMVLESLFYALILAFLITMLLDALLMASVPHGVTKLQMFALSLGAGLYEELFFRVILVSLLVWLFRNVFKKSWMVSLVAILLAALIFSSVHYMGAYGDPWSLHSFLFRFLFAIALNILFLKRGFGIAAWTHALYDVMVLLFQTTL